MSSCETNKVKFKNLSQKKTVPIAKPLIVAAPPISQVPPPIIDSIMVLAEAILGVEPNSFEAPLLDKPKGKELKMGTPLFVL